MATRRKRGATPPSDAVEAVEAENDAARRAPKRIATDFASPARADAQTLRRRGSAASRDAPAGAAEAVTPAGKLGGNAGATRESGSASTRRTRRADASTPSAAAESADVVRAGAGAGDSAATDAQLDAPPAPGSSDEPAADGLTAYECERLANLERNRTMLESLGLLSAAEAVRAQKRPARAAPSARGLALPKKKEAAPAAPERRSLRAQGKTPDGQFAAGVHAEGADGSVVVMVGGEAIRYSAAAAAAAALRAEDGIARREALERQARLDADRPFFSVNCTPRTDAAFVRLLAAAAPCAPAAAGDAAERAAAPPLGALCALALREGHVAKLTPRDIVHLGFQPRSDCLLLCAADKAGHVALWDVHGTADAHAGAADGDGAVADEGTGGADGAEGGVAGVGAHEADKGAPDGVLLLKPHDQYISGLKWSTHVPSRLFTASYDGTVRCLDLTRAPSARDGASGSGSGSGGATGGGCATAAFSLVLHAQDHEISAFETDASGVTAFFADNQGALGVIDVRTRAMAAGCAPLALHDRKVNMLSLDTDGVRLASCSTDSTVCVWDVRTLGKGCKAVYTLEHSKSCQAAAWAPDGTGRLLTTCYDDTLRIWERLHIQGDGAGASTERGKRSAGTREAAPALQIRHNCNTGRWIVPFRAIWAPAADGVIVGSMQRQMHLLDAGTGKLVKAYESELMTAIPARNAAHPTLAILAGGTASGRAHIFRCA